MEIFINYKATSKTVSFRACPPNALPPHVLAHMWFGAHFRCSKKVWGIATLQCKALKYEVFMKA